MSEWQDRAACKGMTDLFFTDTAAGRRIARDICDECPVFKPCAEAGRDEDYGLWAGKSPGQRTEKRRRTFWLRCVVCDRSFEAKSRYANYCGPRCRDAMYRLRRGAA